MMRFRCQPFIRTFLLICIAQLLLVGLGNSAALAASEKMPLQLTTEERAWIAAHPKIVVGGELDWAPFDFVDNSGRHAGIANDYLQVIAKELGLEIEIITDPSWNKLLDMIRNKEIDLLPALYHSMEREKFLSYTPSYAQVTEFIYARDDNSWISSLDDLKGKNVAVVKGYTVEGIIRSDYPDINLVTAANIQECLKKLVIGEVDAFLGDIASTSYNIKTFSLSGIKAIAPGPFPEPTVHMGVRNDWPELRSLIQKVLAALPKDRHDAIRDRWMSMSGLKTETEAVGKEIKLTVEERAWLKQHPVIRVHNESDWPPFNFFEDGVPQGLSIDYMNLLASKLGLKVEYVTGPSWGEFLEMMKRGELDVMLNIVKTEGRLKYLLFTEAYANNPNTILSKTNAPYHSLDELVGKTVSVPKGFFYEEVLARDYPKIKVLPLKNTYESMTAVSFGKADAALGELAVFNHLIGQHLMTDVSVTGEVKIGDKELSLLNIATRKDMPLLASILRKGMKSVSGDESRIIRQKWLGQAASVAEGDLTLNKGVESEFSVINLIVSFVVVIVILLVAISLLRRLGHGVGDKIFSGRNSSWVITGLVSTFLVIVMLTAWLALERMDRQLRDDLGETLTTVNSTVKYALEMWLESRANEAHHVVDDHKLSPIVEALLALPHTPDAILKSHALSESRKLYHYHNEEIGALGYFIIAPDGISLASSRDGNTGTKNLIVEQQPELMKRVFAGESLFVPPIYSDVALKDATGRLVERAATMFFATPVRNSEGEVIAAFTLRFDPVENFSRISLPGRVGKTGESYVFDQNGRLLTGSRFEGQLEGITNHYRDQTRLLSMQLRDPGGDLTQGYQPETDRSSWPLTLMAKEATAGRDGLNVEGYRDYRGVPVMGAWSWSEELQVGLATEIDQSEALESYESMRMLILGALGAIALISLLLTAFAVWVGERARSRLRVLVDERTEELEESQERFELAIRGSGDALWEYDAVTGENWFSPRFTELLGYEKGELSNTLETWKEHIHPDDAEGAVAAFGDHLESDVEYDIEYRMRTKDGQYRWFSARAKSLRDDQGKAYRTSGTVSDIQNRKLAEEALTEAEARSRLLLDAVGEGIFGVDSNGQLTFINPAGASMLGFTLEEMIGEKVHSLIHHTKADGTPYPVEECLMHQSFTEGVTGTRDDEVLWRKDGSCFPVLYNSVPVRDAEDALVGAVIVFLDITERKQAEDEVNKTNFLSDIALELTECGYWHVDYSDPDYYYQSDRAAKILGDPPREDGRYHLMDEWFANVKAGDPEAAEVTAERYQGAIDGKYPHYDATYAYKSPVTGEVVWVHAAGKLVRDDSGKALFMYGAYQDITARVLAENELSASMERFKVLFDFSSDAHMLFNQNGAIDCNDAAVQMLAAKDKSELLNLHPATFSPEFQPDGRRSDEKSIEMDAIAREKGVHRFDWVHKKLNEEEFPVEVSLTPVTLEGEAALLVVWHDLTERKKAEQELQAKFDELERFHRMAIGRELKMIELKTEINESLQEMGEAPRYKIVSSQQNEKDNA